MEGQGFRGGTDEKLRRIWLGLEIFVAGLTPPDRMYFVVVCFMKPFLNQNTHFAFYFWNIDYLFVKICLHTLELSKLNSGIIEICSWVKRRASPISEGRNLNENKEKRGFRWYQSTIFLTLFNSGIYWRRGGDQYSSMMLVILMY